MTYTHRQEGRQAGRQEGRQANTRRPSRRILLAEDNTAAREFLTDALHALGYSVIAVADGQAALAAARAEPFSAAVLDINLPLLDGIALARLLRTEQPALRLVGCSAEAAVETRAAALAAGMDAYLAKPVSLDELSRALTPTESAPANAGDIFSRLHSPTTLARARDTLRTEWPRLRADTTAALVGGDHAAAHRLAHYLRTTALLVGDATLADLCTRLADSASAATPDNALACLADINAHLRS